MRFLSFILDGSPKKSPLKKEVSILGRNRNCDIVIDKEFISKSHLEIRLTEKGISLTDLNSKNGLLVNDFKVKSTDLAENESFRIGHIHFVLKEGDSGEFEISESSRILLQKIDKLSNDPTKQSINMFDKALIYLFELGLKLNNIYSVIMRSELPLKSVLKEGAVYLIESNGEQFIVKSELCFSKEKVDIHPVLKNISDAANLFKEELVNHEIDEKFSLNSFPVINDSINAVFLFVTDKKNKLAGKKLRFIKDFVAELGFLAEYIESNRELNPTMPEIITENLLLLKILSKCKKIADSNINILVQGETGTGKELFSKFIHFNSKKKPDRYIALNCSAIPEHLLEDELFGHEKGGFTGAVAQKKGKLELASGGTLVLDEIGDMPLNLQSKLLRVLQENEFYRIGGNIPIKVDLRVISLTNKNIKKIIREGTFREDLFFRIAQFTVEIPPLRERKDDIVPLINYFIGKLSLNTNMDFTGFTDDAVKMLVEYNWPGNIRQLESTVNLIINLVNSNEIVNTKLIANELNLFDDIEDSPELQKDTVNITKAKLIDILNKNKWHKSKTARELNISRTALYKKLKKFKIESR